MTVLTIIAMQMLTLSRGPLTLSTCEIPKGLVSVKYDIH